MKHLLSFELFEANIGEIIRNNPLPISDFKMDVELITSSEISNTSRGINIFGIDYDEDIKISYNHTPEHDIIDRIKKRTPFMSVGAFNLFLSKALHLLYPKYFFKTYNSIDDIENDEKISLFTLNTQGYRDFSIIYKLSRRYDSKEKKYVFYIYIVTILSGSGDNRTIDIKYVIEYDSITDHLSGIKEDKNNLKNKKTKIIFKPKK